MSAVEVAPQVRPLLEGAVAALQRIANSELDSDVVERMHELGERKEFLDPVEKQEYARLVNFWMKRTIEKADATVALQRIRDAVPDLVASL